MKTLNRLFIAALLLAALFSCKKEDPSEPVTIYGNWVFSNVNNGKGWEDLSIDKVYVFDGKGGYYVKDLKNSSKVNFYNGQVYADESSFELRDSKTYTATKSGTTYNFQSLSGKYVLESATDALLTFKVEGSGASGYKLAKVAKFAASEKPVGPEIPDSPEDPDDQKVRINGSEIIAGNDLVGLITDKDTGKGIPGVIVTDEYNCTTTDQNGVYQFKSNPRTRFVYYTTPAEYKIAVAGSPSVPVFYKAVQPKGEVIRTDFSLQALPGGKETNWTFVGIGDPQCATSSDANRYASETIPDLKKTLTGRSNVYAMTLGDIVFDSTNMWPTVKSSMSSVNTGSDYVIFFQTIGNHDHDSLQQDGTDNDLDDYNATSTFGKYFGPVNYSFDRGDVHIVSMDDIIVTEKKSSSKSNGFTWSYNAGFTQRQIDWLRQDIALVENKASKMIFVCCHIPFRGSASNHFSDVLKLMDEFKEAHLMIGHTHYTQNYIYTTSHKGKGGLPLYEHIHGSACGAWWTKTCSSTVSGEPSGYTVYDVEGAHIKDWFFKGTNKDKDFQLRVYDGDEIYYQSGTYPLNWYTSSQKVGSYSFAVKGNPALKSCFVAQVFNDDDANWKVYLYNKSTGSKIGEFKRLANGSCSNAAMSAVYYNVKGKSSDSYRSWTASHYWYYKPSGAPSSLGDWEVVAVHTLPGGAVSHTYKCSTLTVEAGLEKEFYF